MIIFEKNKKIRLENIKSEILKKNLMYQKKKFALLV